MTHSHDVTTAERSRRPENFLTHPAAVVAGARRDPTRVAVRFKRDGSWVEWSRIRLVEAVAAAARSLTELGLQPGDRVGVFAPSGVDWYIAALGVQSAGGIVVGAYPTSYWIDHLGKVVDYAVDFDPGDESLLAAKLHMYLNQRGDP